MQRKHEAVELRLGQRIGAFLLDRVLRGHDEERIGQRARLAGDGDLVLLHRFEQRGLRLRRRAIHFVREEQIGEDRPGEIFELQLAFALLEQLRADDVARHQIGRELDALETERQRLREAAHEQRLREARHADEQAVAARKKAHEQQPDDRLLADHDLAEFRGDPRVNVLHCLRGNFSHSV